MLRVFVRRDIQEQYAGTLLGSIWALVQPLLLVLIYWWVFGVVWALKVPALARNSEEISFIVFLLSALLPWLALQEAINKAALAIVARGDVLRHGQFPAEIFVLARVFAIHGVFVILLAGFILIARTALLWQAPWVLPALALLFLLQTILASAVGLLVAALSVYLRDLPHILGMALMAVFFTAPVLYPLAQVPAAARSWIWLNPFTPFAQAYQSLLLGAHWPDAIVWAYIIALCGGAVLLARFAFARLRPGFADVL